MGTFLVTGGAGFIGSHLVRKLTADKHDVRILDDFSTGRRDVIPASVEVFEGDIGNREITHTAMTGVDVCFHLAAIADVQFCNTNWTAGHRVNASGSVNIFEAASTLGGIPVVWASSAAVYGVTNTSSISETACPNPIGPYGADKLASELYARVAANLFGVRNIGLRFFNVYGHGQNPRSPYAGVLSIFSERIKNGSDITVFGNGKQTRDFIHVSDVVRALVAAEVLLQTEPRNTARIMNVCTGRETSILDAITYLDAIAGTHSRVKFADSRPGDIDRSCGDISLMARELGIHSTIPLSEGLKDLLRPSSD